MPVLGAGWWRRTPPPPEPARTGDVTQRVAEAVARALAGPEADGERSEADGGAVAAAAAAYSRAMAGATVTTRAPETAAAIRRILPLAGRLCVAAGEAAWMIHDADGLALEPVLIIEGHGDWAAPRWTVRRTAPTGDWTDVRTGADRILHVVWHPDEGLAGLAGRPPWRGHAARAAANIEGSTGDMASLPSGHLVRVSGPADLDDDAVIEFYEAAEQQLGPRNRSKFRAFLTQQGSAEQFMDTYGADHRTGAGPLLAACSETVAAACGLPPVLLSRTVAGAGFRDAWRAFVTTSVQAACDVLAAAVADRLGIDCEIEARARHNTPADLVSRARAAQSLTGAGAATDEALRIAGLDAA